ncbi:MAG: hypothetical protein WD824_10840 [Cyclobacteriaceae bacterium]
MNLSPEHIRVIEACVKESRITLRTLQDDLVDHLCCEVANNLKGGLSFEESLKAALADLAPKGLYEIQEETDFLLTSKYMIAMKKLTYLIGLLSAMAMSFGWLLRILRMGEFGNAVFAFGALGFALLFLPMIVINYFKDNPSKRVADKLRFIFGAFGGVFIAIGFLTNKMRLAV